MRRVTVVEELAEREARPPEVFQDFVEACLVASREVRGQPDGLSGLAACPACRGVELLDPFARHGYVYLRCASCWSVYATPRPSPALLSWYQHDSPAANCRKAAAYRARLAERMEVVALERGERMRCLGERCEGALTLYQPRNPRLVERLVGADTVVVDPLPPLERDGMPAGVECFGGLEEVPAGRCAVVGVFDALEHSDDPARLMEEVARVLAPGGVLTLSARAGSGLDVLALWEQAEVYPLEHLNLLSVEGAQRLLRSVGLEVLEVSTPGLLDAQVIRRVAGGAGECVPRFLRYLLRGTAPESERRLQAFLQENLLSSHMRLTARKPHSGAKTNRGSVS